MADDEQDEVEERDESGESEESDGAEPPEEKPTDDRGDDEPIWRRAARWTPEVLATLAVFGAISAVPADGVVARPAIWQVGRMLGGLAGALVLAGRARGGELGDLLIGGGLVTGAVALAALVGRNPQWHLSPFARTNSSIAVVPSVLPFVGLTIGAGTLLRRPESTLARGLFSATLLWTTAIQFVPHWWLREGYFPPNTALKLLDGSGLDIVIGLVLFAAMLPVLGGWLAAFAGVWTDEDDNSEEFAASAPALRLAAAGAGLLAVHHLLAPWFVSGFTFLRFTAGGFVATLIGLVAVVGTEWLADRSEHPLPERTIEFGDRALEVVIPVAVLAVYVLLKTHGMGPSDTDENVYFYMANELAERGRWPYVDYFFAHPPMHVLIPGALFELFGYSHVLGKTIPVWAGGVSALAVWWIARRHIGRIAGVVAMVGIVFATQWLKSTTLMTGINLTVMFMVLGYWRSLDRDMIVAGALFGIAASTGFYAMAGICAALALGFFASLRDGFRQVAAFAAVFGLINLVFLMVGGDGFVDGVYRYHTLKPLGNPDMVPVFGPPKDFLSSIFHNIGVLVAGDEFSKDLHYHPHLWLSGVLTPLAAAGAWWFDPARTRNPFAFFDPRRIWEDERRKMGLWITVVALALFVQYAMFRELFSFYFTLIHPVLALALGYVVHRGLAFARRAMEGDDGAGWTARLRLTHLATALVVFGVLAAWKPLAIHEGKVFESEIENLGDRNSYEWRPAEVLPGLSGIVRTLFWKDHRLKGNLQRGYLYYLWTKKRDFVSLPKVAGWVREQTEPDETIVGSSTVAPLVALAADRRLALGEADTNNSRFETGMLEEADYWNRACRDNLRVVVSTWQSYFHPRHIKQMQTIQQWFELGTVIKDPRLHYGGEFPIYLWRRTDQPDEEGVVCRYEDG